MIRRVAAGAICAAESARMNWVNAPGAQAGELCQESRSDVFRSALALVAALIPLDILTKSHNPVLVLNTFPQ